MKMKEMWKTSVSIYDKNGIPSLRSVRYFIDFQAAEDDYGGLISSYSELGYLEDEGNVCLSSPHIEYIDLCFERIVWEENCAYAHVKTVKVIGVYKDFEKDSGERQVNSLCLRHNSEFQ